MIRDAGKTGTTGTLKFFEVRAWEDLEVRVFGESGEAVPPAARFDCRREGR